jgi:hypothetical protein
MSSSERKIMQQAHPRVTMLELGAPILVGHKLLLWKPSFRYANRASFIVFCKADPDEVHGYAVWHVEKNFYGEYYAEDIGDYYPESDLVEAIQDYDSRR